MNIHVVLDSATLQSGANLPAISTPSRETNSSNSPTVGRSFQTARAKTQLS